MGDREMIEITQVYQSDRGTTFSTEGLVDEIINDIENVFRPPKAYARGEYASAKAYTQKYIPGVVAVARAGVGEAVAEASILEAVARGPGADAQARATISRVEASAHAFVGHAHAKVGPIVGVSATGPNAGAGAHVSLITGVGVMVNLGLAKVSANVGPFTATAGIAADTGASVGKAGVKIKILGTGIDVGPGGVEVSLFGSSFKIG